VSRVEAALRAAFEAALPELVRAVARELGSDEPRPLTARDRARARTALRRLGLLPGATEGAPYVRVVKPDNDAMARGSR